MIRVVLAEDQGMVLGALAALLNLEEDIEVIGTAPNGGKALAMIRSEQPDVLVSDIEMPEMSGLDLAKQLKEENSRVRILILTTFARPGFLRRALEAGVLGYMLKDSPSEQLAEAVRRVNRGLRTIEPQLALEAWGDENPLSSQQIKILNLVGQGEGNREIGQKLHLAEGTVRNYMSDALLKLDARNRTEAYRMAKQRGWL